MTKTDTETTQPDQTKHDQKVVEILAYRMFVEDTTATVASVQESDPMAVWQSSEDTRTYWRKIARKVLDVTEASGLKVRVRSQTKLDAAIEHIRTVPAHKAYTL